MIHEINPEQFDITYRQVQPSENDYICCFSSGNLLIKETAAQYQLPKYRDLKPEMGAKEDCDSAQSVSGTERYYYLFAIAKDRFFLQWQDKEQQLEGYSYEPPRIFREVRPRRTGFALTCAFHLYSWYHRNRFCGACGMAVEHASTERMLQCTGCGNTIFPQIAPAVIVGITHHNRLLLTKYAGREYKKHALVAGFVEIGETPEEAVQREVMEEVGLRVKQITYYKSQPWGFTQSLLLGFFAELDGDDHITLDEMELAEAVWVEREDLAPAYEGVSLTENMIIHFYEGNR